MTERRLEDLLRDPAAHPAQPLDAGALEAAQRAALARFAAETRAPRRRPLALRLLEAAALPLAIGAALYAASGWLGELWPAVSAAASEARGLRLAEAGWAERAGAAMAAQPWLVGALALGVALLWLPPVRAALLGEREG